MPKSRAIAICKAQILDKDKDKTKESVDRNIFYSTKISESFGLDSDENSIRVRGTLVYPTVSRNDIEYTLEELDKASNTVIGTNIKMDHTMRAADNVGVFNSVARGVDGSIMYEATVFNTSTYPDAVQRIQNGLVKYISLETIYENLEAISKDGKQVMRALGLEFVGAAFVDVPGIPNASVGVAESFARGMSAAYENHSTSLTEDTEVKMTNEIIESLNSLKEEISSIKEQVSKLTEQDEKPEETSEETSEETVEETPEETPAEEPKETTTEEETSDEEGSESDTEAETETETEETSEETKEEPAKESVGKTKVSDKEAGWTPFSRNEVGIKKVEEDSRGYTSVSRENPFGIGGN